MLRAREMSAVTQGRNAQAVFSGSLLDQTVSPIERIKLQLQLQASSMCCVRDYELRTHVSGQHQSKEKSFILTSQQLIATLLKSCSNLSEPTSQSSTLFSRPRKTKNLVANLQQGMEGDRRYSKKTKISCDNQISSKELEHIPFLNIIFSKKSFQSNYCADIMKS